MARLKKKDSCPLCRKGVRTWIGVLENGDRKMHCPKCYKITIVEKKVRRCS
jgi:hypothetical protein